MDSKRQLKLICLTVFCLAYSIAYLSSFYPVLAEKISFANLSQDKTPLPQNTPTPTLYTKEIVAAKYGSLEKIPVHTLHQKIKVLDPSTNVEKTLECLDCHAAEENAVGVNKLRYLAKVECTVCHIEDNDERANYPHPQTPTGRETLTEYSHVGHLDPRGRISPNGQRQDCTHCHNPTSAKASMPTHTQCYSCHSGPKAAKPIFNDQSQECRGCHSEEKIDRNLLSPKEGRAKEPLVVSAHVSYRDVKIINHAKHLKETNGRNIQCLECHADVLSKASINSYAPLPTMNDCSSCHGNVKKISKDGLMDNCVLCHREVNTNLLPFSTALEKLPNESNLNRLGARTNKSMPIDHTATFRLNHREAAKQPNNRCASCHIGVDRINDQNCSSCHNIMQPRSHMPLRFKEIDHGRFAAMSRSNCATCHSTEFCARCHSLLPRDHQPLGIFAGGTHKFKARANMRACLTCHTFENTCQPCHVADANGPIIR